MLNIQIGLKTIQLQKNVEIHKIIYKVLGMTLPEHLKNLNEYNDNNFAYSETIYNPNNNPYAHNIAIVDDKYKYVDWNRINFKKYKLEERIKSALYKWDNVNQQFDEKNNLLNEQNYKKLVPNYQNLTNDIIINNLNHLKKFPTELY